MDFEHSPTTVALLARLRSFMDGHIYPNAERYKLELEAGGNRWKVLPLIEELKREARAQGLWNFFVPPHHAEPPLHHFTFDGTPLTNLEYAPLAEEMGKVLWCSEVFNCSAPDTGNMEVLARYGNAEQQHRWLTPLASGEIRSAFLMTEPQVASSDATNIETQIRRDGDYFVINGHKWWSTGVASSRCSVAIVMGKSDPTAAAHLQQSQILVPLDAPGVKIERMLDVFGFDDAPHGHAEIRLDNVRVPAANLLLGEGRGFEIAQGRLGPGRIHHCMRIIGAAEVALQKMVQRLTSRKAFGRRISEYSIWEQRIADARIDIEMARLLCFKAADLMDRKGNKAARNEIAMIKIAAPRMAQKIFDDVIQAFGGAGLSSDSGMTAFFARARVMRIADGPDEVHWRTIARGEFVKHRDGDEKARNAQRISTTSSE